MSDEMDEIWALYADDGAQALDAMETALMALGDGSGADQDAHVSALFRAVHTFKGNSRVLGLAVVESRAHHSEDLIGLVRDQGVPWDAEIKEILLLAADTLRVMRQCFNPGNGYFLSPVTEQMSADLYPDLGYGEITRYQANYVAIPWSTTRVERHGTAALVSIKTSSQAPYAQRQTRAWLAYWAKGGNACPKLFEMPPAE